MPDQALPVLSLVLSWTVPINKDISASLAAVGYSAYTALYGLFHKGSQLMIS